MSESFEAEGTTEKKEVTDDIKQVKVPEQTDLSKGEKKRVRLTIGVNPEDDRERIRREDRLGVRN